MSGVLIRVILLVLALMVVAWLLGVALRNFRR
jgi:hypothetical protein